MSPGSPGPAGSGNKPERNLPLILTTALPGLGHWHMGRRVVGGLCTALSLMMVSIVLVDAAFLVPMALAFARDPFAWLPDGFIPLAASMLGLTGFGLIYTGLLVWDIRSVGAAKGGGVPGAVIVAVIGAVIAAAVCGYLTRMGIGDR
jgi:hypothetical protein